VREILLQQALERYYAASPDDQVYWDPANEGNLNFFDCRLKKSIEKLKPSGRLLDIGSHDIMTLFACKDVLQKAAVNRASGTA
jgi:hypothetical protein